MPKTLTEAGKEEKKYVSAEIVRSGEQLVIPNDMSLDDVIRVAQARKREDEEPIALQESFDPFISESLYAMSKTLEESYGWMEQVKTPAEGWFDTDTPPRLISVKTGPKKTVQIPWGRFHIPTIPKEDGYFQTDVDRREGQMIRLRLTAKLRKKHAPAFHKLCEQIKLKLESTSLYRGKAVTMKFFANGERSDFPEPEFPTINKVPSESVIYSRHIENALEANLFTLLSETTRVRAAGIPLKRGVLLAGSYGTGKTLLASKTAELAINNGWTFIAAPTVADFPDCVQFARGYQPAVVFCEDIDRATGEMRDDEVNTILNTIDGVEAKGTEIMLVLTTNEVEKIHPAMLRPGRLDAIIQIETPNAEAVGRLIRYYAGELLADNSFIGSVCDQLAGSTPSVIREVVERSKLAAIALTAGEKDGKLKLTESSLLVATETMRMHRDLLNKKPKPPLSNIAEFGNVIGYFIRQGIEFASLRAEVKTGEVLEGLQVEPHVPDRETAIR